MIFGDERNSHFSGYIDLAAFMNEVDARGPQAGMEARILNRHEIGVPIGLVVVGVPEPGRSRTRNRASSRRAWET